MEDAATMQLTSLSALERPKLSVLVKRPVSLLSAEQAVVERNNKLKVKKPRKMGEADMNTRNVFIIGNDRIITKDNFIGFKVALHNVHSKNDTIISRLKKKGDFLVDKRGFLRRFSGSQFLQVCWEHKRRKYQCKDCGFVKRSSSRTSHLICRNNARIIFRSRCANLAKGC